MENPHEHSLDEQGIVGTCFDDPVPDSKIDILDLARRVRGG
jgi:hypothetical protein